MLTLTLVPGVVNTLVLVAPTRSRRRGRRNTIAALDTPRALQAAGLELPESIAAAFGMRGSGRRGIRTLFSSHPPVEKRFPVLRARGRRVTHTGGGGGSRCNANLTAGASHPNGR